MYCESWLSTTIVLKTYLALFAKETLNDHLQKTLKEFKTNNSNEEVSKRLTLQFDEMLECLKAMDEHAPWNVLKKQHNFIDRTSMHSQNPIF